MILDVLLLFLASFIPIGWLYGGYTIFGYDSGFRLSGMNHINSLLQNWNPMVNYGIDWSISRAFSLMQLPEAAVSSITGSFNIAQMAVFVGWFFLIGVSMYVFLRSIFPQPGFRFFRIFSSIFYVYNFFVLNGWLNAERAKFSLFAALPIAILLMYRQAFERERPIVGAFAFGLLYAIMNGGGSPPLYGATLVTLSIAALVFLLGVWRQKGRLAAIKTLGSYILFGLSFLIFNAYWIFPLIAYAKASYTSSVAAQGGIGGLIAWENVFSRNASFLNIFRLQGFPDWYDNPLHPYANGFLFSPLLIVASFLPILSILIGVLKFGIKSEKRHYLVLFLFTLLCASMLMTAGSHPPTGYAYVFLMRFVPGFAIFRSGFYKFAPGVWFPIVVLSGYYLSLFIEKYGKNDRVKTIIWVVCILGILAYHYPFFSSRSFEINRLFRTRVQIPRYVYVMKQEIEQKTTIDDRILILPDLDPGYITLPMDAYSWGFFSADILPRVLTNRSFVAGDANDDAITKQLYDSFYTRDTSRFRLLASLTGVTYILWRGDVRLSEATNSIHTLTDDEQMLESMSGIISVAKAGPWQLYKIESQARPMISVVANPTYATGTTKGDSLFVGNSATIRTEPESYAKSPVIIGAECVMCDPDEFKKLEAGIYLPSTDKGITVWVKQIIGYLRPRSKITLTAGELIDEKLSEALANLSSANFPSLLDAIERSYDQLTQRTQIVYANRLYAYMLAMQRLSLGSPTVGRVAAATKIFKDKLIREIFMSDDFSFRYMVTVPAEGSYRIVGSDKLSGIIVDGVSLQSSTVNLTEGFHKIELSRGGRTQAPFVFLVNDNAGNGTLEQISFRRLSSIAYDGVMNDPASESAVLILNQRFDPRWQLTFLRSDRGRELITRHVEANGFANGWLLSADTAGRFEITYATQKYGTIGWVISAIALSTGGIVAAEKYFRKKQ